MARFDGIIFDWAGTTVDYGCFAPVEAFAQAFAYYGVVPAVEEVRAPMGLRKRDHVRTMMEMERIGAEWRRVHGRDFTEDDVEQVYKLSEKKILELLPRFTDVKPYVLETAEALRHQGIRIGSTTGYTDEMMELVVPAAAEKGYRPDCWFGPDSTHGKGRPFPYMIFRNMEALGLSEVSRVMKVGDTISDIKEGKNAGVFTVGVVQGSSLLGLSLEEYEKCSEEQRQEACWQAEKKFFEAGADAVVADLRGILEFL